MAVGDTEVKVSGSYVQVIEPSVKDGGAYRNDCQSISKKIAGVYETIYEKAAYVIGADDDDRWIAGDYFTQFWFLFQNWPGLIEYRSANQSASVWQWTSWATATITQSFTTGGGTSVSATFPWKIAYGDPVGFIGAHPNPFRYQFRLNGITVVDTTI